MTEFRHLARKLLLGAWPGDCYVSLQKKMSNNYELSQAMSSVIELFAITERQTSFPIRLLNWFKWKPSNLKHIYFFPYWALLPKRLLMLSMVRESKFTRWHSRSIVTPSSRKQISLHAWLTEEGLCSLYKETRISTLTRQEIRIYLMMIKKTTSVLVFLSLFVRWSLMGKPSSCSLHIET